MTPLKYASWVLTFIVYSLFLNYKTALIIMIGIGFHECCHLLAAKQMGLKTAGFALYPFIGGLATIKDTYKTYAQQAYVVLMGPIGGGMLASATASIYWITGIPFIGSAAIWMTFVNLFNLVPMGFLDGGQIVDSMIYSINKTVGLLYKTISSFVMVIFLSFLNPILALIIGFFGTANLAVEYVNWNNTRKGYMRGVDAYYKNPPKSMSWLHIGITFIVYLISALLLTWLMVSLNSSGATMDLLFKSK